MFSTVCYTEASITCLVSIYDMKVLEYSFSIKNVTFRGRENGDENGFSSKCKVFLESKKETTLFAVNIFHLERGKLRF